MIEYMTLGGGSKDGADRGEGSKYDQDTLYELLKSSVKKNKAYFLLHEELHSTNLSQ